MALALNNEIIEKYFGFLTRFDTRSKKKLISKLEESIRNPNEKTAGIDHLYGAWEDSKSSDEIIREIKDSRIDKKDIADF